MRDITLFYHNSAILILSCYVLVLVAKYSLMYSLCHYVVTE